MNKFLLSVLLTSALIATLCVGGSQLMAQSIPNSSNDLKDWKIEAPVGGAATQADTKAPIILKSSAQGAVAISRAFQLLDGLQEIVVEASGSGVLTLEAGGNNAELGARDLALGQSAGSYGLTFFAKPGAQPVRISVEGEAKITSIRLIPAGDEQKNLYQKRQQEIQQLGFYSTSFQRPAPVSTPASLAPDPNLPKTRRVAVLDDARAYESIHVKNGARLRAWLGANGAELLKIEALEKWMNARLEKGDAYGSVMVFTYGSAPLEIAERTDAAAPWLRYLKAGGRIVNIGDVPFYTVASVTGRAFAEPLASDAQAPLDAMRLPYGWNQALWGKDLPTKQTDMGKAWGIENQGWTITGIPADHLTHPFYIYTSENGTIGASSFFKNFSPAKPWGGFVQLTPSYDGANDSVLRDVWRGIYFSGEPVAIPALPAPHQAPAAPTWNVLAQAGGLPSRIAFAVGEKVAFSLTNPAWSTPGRAADAMITLQGPRMAPLSLPVRLDAGKLRADWDSRGFAPGTYVLAAAIKNASGKSEPVRWEFPLVGLPHRDFNYQMWAGLSGNPVRNKTMLDDIKSANMDVYLMESTPRFMDEVLAGGLHFSARDEMNANPPGREMSLEKTPEYFRLDIDRKPFPWAYAGGRATPGISHPDILAQAARSIRESHAPLKNHPGFMGVVIGNDDFSLKYGWDFSPHVTQKFKETTGLDAPAATPTPPLPGVVPDKEPWIAWNEFSLREVSGRFNRAEQEALNSVLPGASFAAIPGGMQIPLINMWNASQYPPLNFGKNGFNLISSYYYNTFWQPQMTTTFYMEAGKMGNRDLPQWTMPDCLGYGPAYVRNNFYHTLAGGVTGMPYFQYDQRRQLDWDEMKSLGKVVANVAPIQAALRPARRKVALLISLSTLSFNATHAVESVYAYHNLMQAGYSVDLLSEEEVLAGASKNYQAVLLHNVGWLRQSVADRLLEYSRSGGNLLLDATEPFDLPGAQRLNLSLGSGEKMAPAKTYGTGIGSRATYGRAQAIADVRAEVSRFALPDFSAPDIRLAVSNFQAGATPYAWFVNAHNGEEYSFGAEQVGAGAPGAGTRQRFLKLWAWQKEQMAKGDYSVEVQLPQKAGAVYDVAGEKQIAVAADGKGGSKMKLSMPRFGGALLAFTRAPVGSLALTAPTQVAPRQAVKFSAQLLDANKKPLTDVLPIHFELTAPDGTKYFDNRGVATKNGVATFDWTPAVNDVAGKWTIVATQKASGKSARATVVLKASR